MFYGPKLKDDIKYILFLLSCRWLFLKYFFQSLWNQGNEDFNFGIRWCWENNNSVQITGWRSCYYHSQ